MRIIKVVILCVSLINISSCVDLLTSRPAPLHKTVHVDQKKYPLPGRVYAMRGWLGIWSAGMNLIAKRANKELGVRAMSVSYARSQRLSKFIIGARRKSQLQGPIILVGHSLGADDQIKVARSLQKANIPVQLLITLDPVTPEKIPTNVKRVINIYKIAPWGAVPAFRGMPVYAKNSKITQVKNINLIKENLGTDPDGVNHFNITKNKVIQDYILSQIRKVLRNVKPAARPYPSGLYPNVLRNHDTKE